MANSLKTFVLINNPNMKGERS